MAVLSSHTSYVARMSYFLTEYDSLPQAGIQTAHEPRILLRMWIPKVVSLFSSQPGEAMSVFPLYGWWEIPIVCPLQLPWKFE